MKIVFFCNDKIEHIYSMEYYLQDIKALEYLGYDVVIVNKFYKIPFKFDILYVWWWSYALIPSIYAKLLNKKVLITGAFNFQEQFGLKNSGFLNRPFYQRILISLSFKIADYNLIVSKKEYVQLFNYFKKNNIIYYPHCISNEYFNNFNLTEQRNQNHLLVITWSGNENLKRKGIYDLINATEILLKRNIDFKLIIGGHIGDGFLNLKNKIEAKELSNHVILLGELTKDEKLSLMRSSVLYLQPSYYEGFGLAAAEALAGGCCLITCDVGEVKEVLNEGAKYVIPGDIKLLADTIENLLLNSNERLSYIEKGRKYLSDNYTFEIKVNNLLKIINKIT